VAASSECISASSHDEIWSCRRTKVKEKTITVLLLGKYCNTAEARRDHLADEALIEKVKDLWNNHSRRKRYFDAVKLYNIANEFDTQEAFEAAFTQPSRKRGKKNGQMEMMSTSAILKYNG
jgi:hypothetical protein